MFEGFIESPKLWCSIRKEESRKQWVSTCCLPFTLVGDAAVGWTPSCPSSLTTVRLEEPLPIAAQAFCFPLHSQQLCEDNLHIPTGRLWIWLQYLAFPLALCISNTLLISAEWLQTGRKWSTLNALALSGFPFCRSSIGTSRKLASFPPRGLPSPRLERDPKADTSCDLSLFRDTIFLCMAWREEGDNAWSANTDVGVETL